MTIKKYLTSNGVKLKKKFGEILLHHYERYLRDLDMQVRDINKSIKYNDTLVILYFYIILNKISMEVKIREAEYRHEKSKADEINNRLLPPYIVEQLKVLKSTERIESKFYDEVSLYFSDIVGFTTIGKQSTPSQIMVMMDGLFHLFDDIITNFKCTKVETIGDAYFVVSGCPEPFEDHAGSRFYYYINLSTSWAVEPRRFQKSRFAETYRHNGT